MNKEELQKHCADLIGVSTSEKEIAFEVMQEKVLEQLQNSGDAIRIDNLGVFQYKENEEDNTAELIFSQIQNSSDTKTMFMRLPVKRSIHEDTHAEDIFSVSVGKPIVPLNSSYKTEEDFGTSFIYIKKRIEERVSELLQSSELLSNFNLWDDYLKSLPSRESHVEKDKTESLLDELNVPDPEHEPEEEDRPITPAFVGESELYSYPPDEKIESSLDDEIFDDLETFKNIDEKEMSAAGDIVFDELDTMETEKKKPVVEDTPKVRFEDDEQAFNEDDIFDIDKLIFNQKEDKKFDWNWGDELKSDLPEEEIIVSPASETKEEPIEETPEEPLIKNDFEEKEEVKKTEIDSDPFGTLEQTLELDPEFKMLTTENVSPEKIIRSREEEYRITNLNKPRPIPPPPTVKTRFTRLTSPVEEPVTEEKTVPLTPSTTTSSSGYKNSRDSYSKSNIFVIGGIIVILMAIIYFAFSVGDSPTKEMLELSTNSTSLDTETDIVSSEPTQTVPTTVDNTISENTPSANTNKPSVQKDNTSQVEEIRISNLIFRRGNEYNVQVSSWRSPIKAENEMKRLKARGYKAFIVQAYLPSKGGTWHRVRIGGFKSEDEARNFLNNTQL